MLPPENSHEGLQLDIAAAEQAEAQRTVARYLVAGCEQALTTLRSELGAASTPADVRVGLDAAELLESILADWRSVAHQLE